MKHQALSVAHRHRTLELNSNQEAIRFRSGISALRNLIKGRAMAIRTRFEGNRCVEWEQLSWEDWCKVKPRPGDAFIGTAEHAIVLPTTIVSIRFDRIPRKTVRLTRVNLFNRDGGVCQYCSGSVTLRTMQIEHVHPRSRGGKLAWDNAVASCRPCNQRKADKTPEEAGMRLVRKPKSPPPLAFMLTADAPTNVPEWDMYLHLDHDRVSLSS